MFKQYLPKVLIALVVIVVPFGIPIAAAVAAAYRSRRSAA